MKLKQAIVNGEPIAREAVQFELDRLIQFYTSHGMSQADVRKNLDTFVEKEPIDVDKLYSRLDQINYELDIINSRIEYSKSRLNLDFKLLD